MGFVTLRAYRDPVDAEVDRAHLELEGIDAIVVDDDLVAMQWQYSNAIGGVKLKVDAADVARSARVLEGDHAAEIEAISAALPAGRDDPGCPACGSAGVASAGWRRRWAALSLLTGLPFVFGGRVWKCRRCGHAWPRGPARVGALAPETIEAERRVQRRNASPAAGLAGLALIVAILIIIVRDWVASDADADPKPCARSVTECELLRKGLTTPRALEAHDARETAPAGESF